jgi:hypothetical protein
LRGSRTVSEAQNEAERPAPVHFEVSSELVSTGYAAESKFRDVDCSCGNLESDMGIGEEMRVQSAPNALVQELLCDEHC